MADIQDYFSRRVALIQEDRSLRRENDLLLSLTANESAADKIVRRIRAEEEVSVWGVEHDEVPHIFPGMEFLMCICPHFEMIFARTNRLSAKSIIEKTKVFKIISKVCSLSLSGCSLFLLPMSRCQRELFSMPI
jgi:adenosine deaminase CECR1